MKLTYEQKRDKILIAKGIPVYKIDKSKGQITNRKWWLKAKKEKE